MINSIRPANITSFNMASLHHWMAGFAMATVKAL
jgi:hypothetical protein